MILRQKLNIMKHLTGFAKIQRAFGLFPTKMSENGLHYSHLSFYTLHSLMSYIAILIFLYAEILKSPDIFTKMKAVWYLSEVYLKCLCYTLTFGNTAQLVSAIQSADVTILSTPIHPHPLLWIVLTLAPFVFYFTLGTYLSPMPQSFKRYLRIFCVSCLYQRDLQMTVLYTFFVCQLRARFRIVRQMVKTPEDGRLAFNALSTCVRVLREAFGVKILTFVLFIGCDTLINIYISVYQEESLSFQALMFSSIDYLTLYVIAKLSEVFVEEGEAIKKDLLQLTTSQKDTKYCQQILLFLEGISCSDLEITAWGVFTINFVLFGSFTNTVLTFFIAMTSFSKDIAAMVKDMESKN